MTSLYTDLRNAMKKDGLVFSASADVKMGAKWSIAFMEVLSRLSRFHDKMQERGHHIPKIISFSKGADDFKKKGKAAQSRRVEIGHLIVQAPSTPTAWALKPIPMRSQELAKVEGLCLSPFLDQELETWAKLSSMCTTCEIVLRTWNDFPNLLKVKERMAGSRKAVAYHQNSSCIKATVKVMMSVL